MNPERTRAQLYAEMKRARMSQKQLAELTGIPAWKIGQTLRGEREPANAELVEMVTATGTTMSAFYRIIEATAA